MSFLPTMASADLLSLEKTGMIFLIFMNQSVYLNLLERPTNGNVEHVLFDLFPFLN